MFLVVGKNDVPLYEANLWTVKKDNGYLNQFIIHAALDNVDEECLGNGNMYLKVIDRFADLYVSAYVTSSNIRLMLIHEDKNEDGIKNFFSEVHEMLIKVMLNPMFELSRAFPSGFDGKVKISAKKFLL